MPVAATQPLGELPDRARLVAGRLEARLDVEWHVPEGNRRSRRPPERGAASPQPQSARREASRLLDAARAEAETLAPGRVTAELLEGDPAWEVVKFAAERGQDLLVVGTHGRTGVRRLVVGSIAEQVLRGARCPVLAVREPGASTE